MPNCLSNCCVPRKNKPKPAFTLIKLLVVVAIIALLMPSLSQAREQAKKATCLANLHQQLGWPTGFYQSENDGYHSN